MTSIAHYTSSDCPVVLLTRREFVESGLSLAPGILIVGWLCDSTGVPLHGLYFHPDYDLTMCCLAVYLYCQSNSSCGWLLSTGSRNTQTIIWNTNKKGLGLEYWGWNFLTPTCLK